MCVRALALALISCIFPCHHDIVKVYGCDSVLKVGFAPMLSLVHLCAASDKNHMLSNKSSIMLHKLWLQL